MRLKRFDKKVKLYILTYFIVNNTKYKAIQPLCVMELQIFNKKIKLFNLTYFSVKNTKYKAIQPLCGIELERCNKKETDLHCQSHSFEPTVILITTNIGKAIFGKASSEV